MQAIAKVHCPKNPLRESRSDVKRGLIRSVRPLHSESRRVRTQCGSARSTLETLSFQLTETRARILTDSRRTPNRDRNASDRDKERAPVLGAHQMS